MAIDDETVRRAMIIVNISNAKYVDAVRGTSRMQRREIVIKDWS